MLAGCKRQLIDIRVGTRQSQARMRQIGSYSFAMKSPIDHPPSQACFSPLDLCDDASTRYNPIVARDDQIRLIARTDGSQELIKFRAFFRRKECRHIAIKYGHTRLKIVRLIRS